MAAGWSLAIRRSAACAPCSSCRPRRRSNCNVRKWRDETRKMRNEPTLRAKRSNPHRDFVDVTRFMDSFVAYGSSQRFLEASAYDVRYSSNDDVHPVTSNFRDRSNRKLDDE